MAPCAGNERRSCRASFPSGSASLRRAALMISSLQPGGGERVMVHLATSLRDLGVHTDVVCLEDEGRLGVELREQGIAPHVLGSTAGWDLKAIVRLRKLLRSLNPDVVNVHDRASLPYLVSASPLGRWPIVYTAHGLLFNAAQEPMRRYRLALRWVRSAIAVSQEVADRHRKLLRFEGPWEVIPNGVPDVSPDPDAAARIRGELGISPDVFVFLAMGNVREEKGFEDLLEAVEHLGKREPDRPFVCLVAGNLPDTPYARGIRRQREERGLDDTVRLLGFRSDGDDLRAAADAFVLSSRSEGMPMVILEAMMAEVPIVATRVGGVPDVLAGDAGMLVASHSPQELADSMAEVLRDDNLRKCIAENARKKAVEQFSVRSMADEYRRVYAGALCGKAERAGGS